MYSPKIADELIPLLYRVAKAKKLPMTILVSEILRRELEKERREMKNDTEKDPDQQSD
ncbi:MAG: hypothetical protein L0Y56_21675 [Nitrospira sp.]|nr:hypothetical protein [Nitrospira sp.]